jgi:elongator complex protein 1
LNEVPSELSRFMIDDYLRRYAKALGHLVQCAPEKTFDEVLAYVKKHDLHKDGMRLYKDQRKQYDVPFFLLPGLTIGHSPLLCGLPC